MGIDLIWGNDWNKDWNTKDTGFHDYPHFELKVKKGKKLVDILK